MSPVGEDVGTEGAVVHVLVVYQDIGWSGKVGSHEGFLCAESSGRELIPKRKKHLYPVALKAAQLEWDDFFHRLGVGKKKTQASRYAGPVWALVYHVAWVSHCVSTHQHRHTHTLGTQSATTTTWDIRAHLMTGWLLKSSMLVGGLPKGTWFWSSLLISLLLLSTG